MRPGPKLLLGRKLGLLPGMALFAQAKAGDSLSNTAQGRISCVMPTCKSLILKERSETAWL